MEASSLIWEDCGEFVGTWLLWECTKLRTVDIIRQGDFCVIVQQNILKGGVKGCMQWRFVCLTQLF